MESEAKKHAWSEYSKVKKEADRQFAAGDMTPNAYTRKVRPALDKACDTK